MARLKDGGAGSRFRTVTIKNNSHKHFSPSVSAKKRGPNFTISLIPAFGHHPMQNFEPSIIEARVNLPNVIAKKRLWSFMGIKTVT
jgi:hypothetical protein